MPARFILHFINALVIIIMQTKMITIIINDCWPALSEVTTKRRAALPSRNVTV